MFPSVSSKQQVLIHEKVKQVQWNDRFSTKNQIPQYSPLKDQHTKSYRKIISSNLHQFQQSTIQRKKTYFEKLVQLISQIKQIHESDETTIDEYEDLLVKNKAPTFYIFYSMLPYLDKNDIKNKLLLEIKSVKNHLSYYHKISTAIKARDQCLNKMKKILITLKQTQIQGYKLQLTTQIDHLRYLTTNVIEQIKKWRDSLGKIHQRAIYYAFEEQENYLIKILNDNKFIYKSILSKYIKFAEKNDPFIIVPLKRLNEQDQSSLMEIIAIDKNLAYYQKYMQYLANQKVFQMRKNTLKTQKKHYHKGSIQKIYKANQSRIKQGYKKEQQEIQDEDKNLQKHKMRQERLKKNQERISSIKNIYEAYTSRKKGNWSQNKTNRKLAETDNEGKGNKKKQYYNQQDNQFENMVNNQIQRDRIKIITKKNKRDKRKQKQEDKMINNLKDIQQTLKNKLEIIKTEGKYQVQHQEKYVTKNNSQIVKELKAEIIAKLEKQNEEKDKLRRKKRSQEQKAFEEIKLKMKKQMEDKIQEKKKKKMLERQQLEQRLKQEQNRLNNQRQIELQMQVKLGKEKQLRELEKVKRISLERQKAIKQDLEKERSIRREKEGLIQKEKREKQKLIEELKRKQLKQNLEEEIRNQLRQKQEEADQKYQMEKKSLQYIKDIKTIEMTKEIELLKYKENIELEQIRKENQLRDRMLKLKKDQQELKKQQIQYQMKSIIQSQKDQLERQVRKSRVQLQQTMRKNAKEHLLEEYKVQKQEQIEKIRMQRQKQLQQDVYRQKIKQKIQKQLRIEAIQKTKKQLQERQNRKFQMRQKLEIIKHQFEIQPHIDKIKIQQDVKKDLIEKVIFEKQAERQSAKNNLRAQFQQQLMASAIPQIYETKDNYLLKNINHLEDDAHLSNKIEEQKPTNQKPIIVQHKKSDVKQYKQTLNDEQLYIYSKKKSKVSEYREQPDTKYPKMFAQQNQGFKLMTAEKVQKQELDYDVRIIKKPKNELKKIQEEYPKKKTKKIHEEQEQDSQDVQYHKKNKKTNRRQKVIEQSEQQRKNKRKKTLKKSKRKIEEPSQSIQPQSLDQEISPIKKVNFKTSQDEKQIQKKSKNVIVHYDVDNHSNSKLDPMLNQIEPVVIKSNKITNNTHNNNKFTIKLQAIPQNTLDQYLQSHFSKLPENQILSQLLNREQLYRKLINQLTFCLLLGYHDGKLIGMCFAYHDRQRSDLRKFILIHIGTYLNENLSQFILNITNYIFKKDPSDEIQFHYQFDENKQQLLLFSQQFNKWFDKYGNIYQKKIQDSIFERKYLLKRQFNQKCNVLLGGINKNTFRNIFTIYSTILMSDTDMLQYKQQFKDTLCPENQICYAILIAELFRNYMTPDEADSLKGKVKEFVKLKQLLILVVMLQKKKIKMDELQLSDYKTLVELNMRLMSQGRDIIRYVKDSGLQHNRLYYCQLLQSFNLPFNFQTTSLPVEINSEKNIRQISYFRLAPLPPHKLHIIKSSLYNAECNILPTDNNKYKIFIINAQEYNEIKQQNNLDLFLYIRLFLKNVKSHNVAIWKYVWLPEINAKQNWSIREFRSFLNKDIYAHNSINISYKQFLPGALIIQPQHRDLVITPPFIVGIMSMTLEQVTQGSPLSANIIQINAVKTIQIQD